MAIKLTPAQVAVAIRAAATVDDVPAPVLTVMNILVPAASAMVLLHAPDAPDAIHDMSLVRLVGWLYDADPTDSRISSALTVSGAANLMAPWRQHRAGIIDGEEALSPSTPGGSGLPPIPDSGSFILGTQNGDLSWVAFPFPD